MKTSIAMALAAVVAAGATAISTEASADSIPVRPAGFSQCAGCHSTEAGKTVFGPSLSSVSGRRAGSLPGFAYSTALKSSGLTWNAKALDRWLTSPQQTVPGTRMPFAGISDPVVRKSVVDYLLSLR
ncbi:c-type cytochrome [Sphingobium sp. AS12]|uniref:c-type cytochrome n=1 Tax=Sphingobium sp. AS12 TaxID=2849495 RepID=UPI001C313755|nr:c-type cytochrome [Sphingobium sp. AS12]MBV2150705.1 c-type cytochrome [Sphingobium sp. AS12]